MEPDKYVKMENVLMPVVQMIPVPTQWPALISAVRTRAVYLERVVAMRSVSLKTIELSAVVRQNSPEIRLPFVKEKTHTNCLVVDLIPNAVLDISANRELVLKAVVTMTSALPIRPVLTESVEIRVNMQMRAESMLTVHPMHTNLSVRVILVSLAIHMSNADPFKT